MMIFMNSEFVLKLGILLGSLDDFCIRVRDETALPADIDKIEGLVKDVKKKFFEPEIIVGTLKGESK